MAGVAVGVADVARLLFAFVAVACAASRRGVVGGNGFLSVLLSLSLWSLLAAVVLVVPVSVVFLLLLPPWVPRMLSCCCCCGC